MGGEPHQQHFEQIEEEQTINHYDPADNYKHVAVVDCSKAFSNQEVSYLFFQKCLKSNFTIVRPHFWKKLEYHIFERQ